MKVVFRTDASNIIGTGHVMRCLNLAEALRDKKVECEFICREHDGNLLGSIEEKGFRVKALPLELTRLESESENYGLAWLGVTPKEDARQAARAIDGTADWIIVDHYAIDQSWESQLYQKTEKLMVIDDLANRKHLCDLLVDQNWYGATTSSRYDDYTPGFCKKLLGPQYAILDSEYSSFRNKSVEKTGAVENVLVFLGGSDISNQTARVLRVLGDETLRHLELTVVTGPNHPAKAMVAALAEERGNTTLFSNVPGLARIMAGSDLMIGAGGISNWERMCIGLPAVVMSIADNQVEVNEALAHSGLINYLGRAEHIQDEDIVLAIKGCIENPRKTQNQSKKMMELVPGNGAQIITSHLLEFRANATSLAY
jgi:UDP-2,4-diacetamido-2,4,6-trideoxy-beta-L-altropyranose hydrolase